MPVQLTTNGHASLLDLVSFWGQAIKMLLGMHVPAFFLFPALQNRVSRTSLQVPSQLPELVQCSVWTPARSRKSTQYIPKDATVAVPLLLLHCVLHYSYQFISFADSVCMHPCMHSTACDGKVKRMTPQHQVQAWSTARHACMPASFATRCILLVDTLQKQSNHRNNNAFHASTGSLW